MEINPLVQAYTDLSKLDRGLQERIKEENDRPPGRNPEPESAAAQQKQNAPAIASLTTNQAQALAEEMAARIRAARPDELDEAVHDISGIKVIGPRYV